MDPIRIYSDAPCLGASKATAEIDVSALRKNYRYLSNVSCGSRQIAVVKADAYGHSIAICVPALLSEGCDFFAVSCIEEAIAVRNICRHEKKSADVLILGYSDSALAPLLAEYDIIQTAVSESHAGALASSASAAGVSIRIHVALDTGMNRIGISAETDAQCIAAADTVKELVGLKGLKIEGLFTHFSRADENFSATDGDEFTKTQFARFDFVRKRLEFNGIKLFCHVSNSAATLRFPEYALDGVRLGIALYGVNPSPYVGAKLSPVMSFKTYVTHVNNIAKGERVGYGGAYCAPSNGVIATLPIGYADGFLRAFSGCSLTVHTASGDVKAPVIGRICMDQCMIDVSDANVSVGDAVTVFGADPKDLSRLADLSSTIEYEVICLISARVPRIAKRGE